jgi:GNAT superfamily N-acetyltransferase
MQIQVTTELTMQQKQEICLLLDACKKQEAIYMEPVLNAEENIDPNLPCFYLAYGEEGSLTGFVSVFLPEEKLGEIMAYTRPEYRRKGVLTALLKKMKEELGSPDRMFFLLSHGKGGEAERVAAHWQLPLDHEEWMMEIPVSELEKKNSCPKESKRLYLRRRQEAWYLYQGQDSRHTGSYIGKCFLSPLGDQVSYLYGLEIRKEWRNQGYGRSFLVRLAGQICKEDQENRQTDHRICLQVSTKNPVACQLYRSCGFEISERIGYYKIR